MRDYKIYIVGPDGSKSEIRLTHMNMSFRHTQMQFLGSEYAEHIAPACIDVSMNAVMTPDQAAELRKSMYMDDRFHRADHVHGYRQVPRYPEQIDPVERERKLSAKRAKLMEQLLETFKDDYEPN